MYVDSDAGDGLRAVRDLAVWPARARVLSDCARAGNVPQERMASRQIHVVHKRHQLRRPGRRD